MAKVLLSNKILNTIVTLENIGIDDKGQFVADVFCVTMSCAKWLIDRYLAIEYVDENTIIPECWFSYYSKSIDNPKLSSQCMKKTNKFGINK